LEESLTHTRTTEQFLKHFPTWELAMKERRRLLTQAALRNSAAPRDVVYAAGDEAILLYSHKGRTYQIPVVVEKSVWEPDHRFSCEKPSKASPDIAYVVRSVLGGTMTVGSRHLRHGSVLDRIAIALEFDDALDLD